MQTVHFTGRLNIFYESELIEVRFVRKVFDVIVKGIFVVRASQSKIHDLKTIMKLIFRVEAHQPFKDDTRKLDESIFS